MTLSQITTCRLKEAAIQLHNEISTYWYHPATPFVSLKHTNNAWLRSKLLFRGINKLPRYTKRCRYFMLCHTRNRQRRLARNGITDSWYRAKPSTGSSMISGYDTDSQTSQKFPMSSCGSHLHPATPPSLRKSWNGGGLSTAAIYFILF